MAELAVVTRFVPKVRLTKRERSSFALRAAARADRVHFSFKVRVHWVEKDVTRPVSHFFCTMSKVESVSFSVKSSARNPRIAAWKLGASSGPWPICRQAWFWKVSCAPQLKVSGRVAGERLAFTCRPNPLALALAAAVALTIVFSRQACCAPPPRRAPPGQKATDPDAVIRSVRP